MKQIHRGWLAAALVGAAACTGVQDRADVEMAVADALISEQQEAQLGEQIHQQLAAEGVKLSKDPVVVPYVERLLAQLTPYAKKDRDTAWHVHVIDDPKQVNAFATPGGHLYVFSGLLLAANSESEVIGVMGHELGHVVARHAARSMVAQFGLQTIAALAMGQNPGMLAQVAASIAANGAILAHSRADEYEADVYAVRYSSAAGYDPRGIALFFRRLPTIEGRLGQVLSWMQTHPTPPDRIERVNQVIARERLSGPKIGTDSLAPIKQHIQSQTPVSWK